MPLARRSRLVLLEASKVRHYHSTLVEGIVRAYVTGTPSGDLVRPQLLAHRSLFSNLGADVQAAVDYRPIPVMDQDHRRLIRKSLLEAWVVVRALAKLRRDETLLVTTILPSAMILVELAKHFFARQRLIVLQHGELEGAFEKRRQRPGSFGFYILIWLWLRRFGSSTRIAVLDDFIATALRRHFPRAIKNEDMSVLPLPMTSVTLNHTGIAPKSLRCCFIGFDTPNKGFATFKRLAALCPELEFRVIGGGWDRALGTQEGRTLASSNDFLGALADCDVAVLPYTGGYSCSLSAAATDAIACGLQLLTSDRACFVALAEVFGDGVTICHDDVDMVKKLHDPEWLERVRTARTARIGRIASSRYGRHGVARALAAMLSLDEANARDSISDHPARVTASPDTYDHKAERETVSLLKRNDDDIGC